MNLLSISTSVARYLVKYKPALILVALIASVLSTAAASSSAPKRPPRPGALTSVSMKPLASALHVLEPLSTGSGNQQSPERDAVRAFELDIHSFVAVSIGTGPGGSNSIAQFSTGTGRGPATISLQNYTYHV